MEIGKAATLTGSSAVDGGLDDAAFANGSGSNGITVAPPHALGSPFGAAVLLTGSAIAAYAFSVHWVAWIATPASVLSILGAIRLVLSTWLATRGNTEITVRTPKGEIVRLSASSAPDAEKILHLWLDGLKQAERSEINSSAANREAKE